MGFFCLSGARQVLFDTLSFCSGNNFKPTFVLHEIVVRCSSSQILHCFCTAAVSARYRFFPAGYCEREYQVLRRHQPGTSGSGWNCGTRQCHKYSATHPDAQRRELYCSALLRHCTRCTVFPMTAMLFSIPPFQWMVGPLPTAMRRR